MFKYFEHNGMTRFVICGHAPFFVAEYLALARRPGHHPLDRLDQFVHADGAFVATRGQDRGLVEQILEVGANQAGRLPGDSAEIDVRT